MKRKPDPTLIGAFVVGGLALLALVVVALAGGELFKPRQRAVMHFGASIYGLDVGAPVVFRGVRVGSVVAIGVYYDDQHDEFAIPVVAELDGDAIRGLDGKRAGAEAALPALVARGLRAQLMMQSLLTGQLYVDLDLRPGQPGRLRGGYAGAVEIPTASTAIQNLKSQLDGIDFRKLVEDISTMAGSVRGALDGPQLRQAMDDLARITGNLSRLSAELAQHAGPLSREAGAVLADTRRAMERVGRAADGVGLAADRADRLLAPDSALIQDLHGAADALAQTAAALRRTAGDDSVLMRKSELALDDMSRAARAVRELAELLERQPQSPLRGRSDE